jgi:hypothetical protein
MTPDQTTRSVPTGPNTLQTTPAWWQQAGVLVLVGGIIMGLTLGVRHVQGLFLLKGYPFSSTSPIILM